jgi:hypothetical protein
VKPKVLNAARQATWSPTATEKRSWIFAKRKHQLQILVFPAKRFHPQFCTRSVFLLRHRRKERPSHCLRRNRKFLEERGLIT